MMGCALEVGAQVQASPVQMPVSDFGLRQARAVRVELANYKRLRELTRKWVGLSLRLAKEKGKSIA
jgi:hypothetical protein